MDKPKILCIGSPTMDVFLSGKVFKPVMDNGTLEEQFTLGAKLPVDNVVFTAGGNSVNAATTFARQGFDTEFMGIVGTEPSGQTLMLALDEEGISTKHIVQDDKFKTSYSTILLATNGERTILNFQGSLVNDDGYPLDLSAIDDSDWLYLSSLKNMSYLEKVITLASKKNKKIAYNPSGRELIHKDKIKPLLEDVSILSVNKEEAKMIFEGETLEELARHAINIVDTVIISDGPKGSITTDGKKIVKAGMYEDVPVIDRTGAGDSFTSGFVSKIASGASLEEAVTFASANSTSVVGQIGAIAGILRSDAEVHDMPLEVSDF